MAAAVITHKNREKEASFVEPLDDTASFIHALPPEMERELDLEVGSFLNGWVILGNK